MDDITRIRVRALWEELASGRFPDDGQVRIVETSRSRLCPPGWCGIVTVGRAVLATAPSAALAAMLRDALPNTAALPIRGKLGPARLAYLAPADLKAGRAGDTAAAPPGEWVDRAELAGLIADTDTEEVDESGIAELTRAVVLRRGGRIVAAAGYRTWPASTAHLCVLTAAEHRGQGLVIGSAATATAHALHQGLLPQWRATTAASLRVAAKLGFQVLGEQLSLKLRE